MDEPISFVPSLGTLFPLPPYTFASVRSFSSPFSFLLSFIHPSVGPFSSSSSLVLSLPVVASAREHDSSLYHLPSQTPGPYSGPGRLPGWSGTLRALSRRGHGNRTENRGLILSAGKFIARSTLIGREIIGHSFAPSARSKDSH